MAVLEILRFPDRLPDLRLQYYKISEQTATLFYTMQRCILILFKTITMFLTASC